MIGEGEEGINEGKGQELIKGREREEMGKGGGEGEEVREREKEEPGEATCLHSPSPDL